MEKNKVLFGLENVHYAKITESSGNITYATPVHVTGAVSLGLNPEGDSSPFYADNIEYYTGTENNGYTGDLIMAKFPDQMISDLFGMTIDSNGVLIENNEDTIAKFALLFEVKGDLNKRRTVFYTCTATRPSRENKTLEGSKVPDTETMPVKMIPRNTDKAVKASIEPNDSNTAVYNAFFGSVYEKNSVISG